MGKVLKWPVGVLGRLVCLAVGVPLICLVLALALCAALPVAILAGWDRAEAMLDVMMDHAVFPVAVEERISEWAAR